MEIVVLFISYGFILFLIIVILLYYSIFREYQWQLLLISSYIFYGTADIRYVFFIAITTITTFYVGCRMEDINNQYKNISIENRQLQKEVSQQLNKKLKALLILGLSINLVLLLFVKYFNFTVANWNCVADLLNLNKMAFANIIVPLGISFYTFQSLGYIIDIYRAKYPAQRNILKYALFVSFFPQLIQGPISRYDFLSKTLYSKHSFDKCAVMHGLQRMLWGFFKKLVIADRVVVAVNTIIHNPDLYQGTFVFVGMILYAVEIYADFTGGIDITIGIAEVCGIRMAENFNHPYCAKSFKEYWKRWHISMGAWFEEYLFYPISISKPMLKLSSKIRKYNKGKYAKKIPVYVTSFIVWIATGLWHGANWNFIVWGIVNWIVIVLTDILTPVGCKMSNILHIQGTRLQGLVQIISTFVLMSCVRLLDCYRDVYTTFKMIGNMVVAPNFKIIFDGSLLELGLEVSDYIVAACGVCIMSVVSLYQMKKGPIRNYIDGLPWLIRLIIWYGLFYVTIIMGIYGIGYDVNQFIYNQF